MKGVCTRCFRILIALTAFVLDGGWSLSLTLDQKSTQGDSLPSRTTTRRAFVLSTSALVLLDPIRASAASISSLSEIRASLKEARDQLNPVPGLIKDEKWDSVRAILITPPISDLWGKTSSTKAVLQTYAEKLGDAGGDELAVLEAREDLVSHLRYLDMAVYNNVFNPIATEGTTGATKELVRSYYEDPINEYKASVASLNEIIALSDDL